MEKGFNDQELADIMSEIESLEREFAEEAPVAQKAAPAAEVEAPVAQEVHEEVVEEVPEETHTEPAVLHELVQKPVAETVLKTNHEEKVVEMKKHAAPAASAPASLTFKVAGEMSVNLAFEVNGQTVELAVTEEGLSIEMESGAKFTLPLAKAEHAKKAA